MEKLIQEVQMLNEKGELITSRYYELQVIKLRKSGTNLTVGNAEIIDGEGLVPSTGFYRCPCTFTRARRRT